MGPMSGRDVSRALEEVSDGEITSGPALTNEQAQEFSALSQISDPEERAAKTSAKINDLLAQVKEGDRRSKELFGQTGLESGDVKGFLQGDRLPEDSRREIEAATRKFQDQVMQAVNDEANRMAGTAKKTTVPRMGRMRV